MGNSYKIPAEMLHDINEGDLQERIYEIYETIDYDNLKCKSLISKDELLQFCKAYIIYAILTELSINREDGELHFTLCNELTYAALYNNEDKIADELSTFLLIIKNADAKKEDLQLKLLTKKLAIFNFKLADGTPEFHRLDKYDEELKKFITKKIDEFDMDINADELFHLVKCYLAYTSGKNYDGLCGSTEYLTNIVYRVYQLNLESIETYENIVEKENDRNEVVRKLRRIIKENGVKKD